MGNSTFKELSTIFLSSEIDGYCSFAKALNLSDYQFAILLTKKDNS